VRQIGQTLGLAVAGSIFTAGQFTHAGRLASQELAADVVRSLSAIGGFQDTMMTALILALIGLAVSLLRGRRHEGNQ